MSLASHEYHCRVLSPLEDHRTSEKFSALPCHVMAGPTCMAARLELPISMWLEWVHPSAVPGQSQRWGFCACLWLPVDTCFPGNGDLGTSVSSRAAGECEQVCLCLGGSQRVLLAVSLRLGQLRRGIHFQVVCSESLSVSTPALHLLCSHHPGQLAAVTA